MRTLAQQEGDARLLIQNPAMTEPFGPRAHPERCEEWPGDLEADWRLTFLCILQAIQTVALVGGAYLFFRWARIACWLTGCGS